MAPGGDLPAQDSQVPEWCTGLPVLVRWTTIAVFCMATGGFGLHAWVDRWVGVVNNSHLHIY